MNGPTEDTARRLAAVKETDTIKQLLSRGISSLNQRGSTEVDPYVTLQLLSQGVERLLKLTVMFQHYRAHGEFGTVKRYSHSVSRLAAAALQTAQSDKEFSSYAAARGDLEFAATDPTLQLILDAFTTFAFTGRYHDLSTATGLPTEPDQSPANLWAAVETSARAGDTELLHRLVSFDSSVHQAALEEINARITATVQRYIRFVVRIWAISPTDDIARSFSSTLQQWLVLTDEQLRAPQTP